MKKILICLLLIPLGFLLGKEKETTMFYFVRHGQTDWNVERRVQGHADIPLNDNGRAQAAQLQKILQSIELDHCYSSDLQRAMETARILVENRPLPIHVDPRLRERNFGIWEGKLSSELAASLEQERMSVETDEEIIKRVFAFLQDVEKRHPGTSILFVTHGGLMRTILAKQLGISADDIHVENMALLQLEAVNGALYVGNMQGIEVS
jgi:broad specificity phosphatase PhoE